MPNNLITAYKLLMMLIETLKLLFERDLNKLTQEIELYRNESNIWMTSKDISNSAGNLCLHLMGNLNTYIGATIGGTSYIRNRELEFSLKNITGKDLLASIAETKKVVDQSLDKITEAQLNAEYPLLVFKEKTSTMFFLVHLTTHLSYHLGQINYHRRLFDF
ncbi:hypothetical protein GCM10011413_21020 [Pedobacter psychrotolerans]|uniref:Damage-inducible protein DinB n=3 Tax=Pedobacter psychrotolerans TaxID=1843235 RepID=A0ABQ1SPL0_9SPHI|nr:hypothetical protein GCM10011413_21020 [Pedobacter psychrotolerans]